MYYDPTDPGGFHFGEPQKRTFPKAFLALSRDDGTVRVHRDSEALCRCKSGTGPRPGIVPASSGSVSVIAALSHLTCQVSVGNDGAREDCGKEKVRLPSYTLEDASRAHSGMCIECSGKAA